MKSALGQMHRAVAGGLALLLGPLLTTSVTAREPTPIIDLHVDISYRSLYKGAPFESGSGEFVAADLVRSGVAGVVLPLYVPLDAKPGGRSRLQLERSYAHVFRALAETEPYALPGCGVRRAGKSARSVETWLAFEGSDALSGTEDELRPWALRGVRSFGLVHAVHNAHATSSGERSRQREGLSQSGADFVRAVYAVGGIVDVSHSSDRATDEAIALARKLGRPIMATHSNARALAAHPRNLTDEQIRGIAQSGGVIGVNFHQGFLNASTGQATLEDVVATIDYLVKIGGREVVAIGSDFEGGIRPVPELQGAAKFQVLADSLLGRGYSAAEVRAFLSGNARRILCPQG